MFKGEAPDLQKVRRVGSLTKNMLRNEKESS